MRYPFSFPSARVGSRRRRRRVASGPGLLVAALLVGACAGAATGPARGSASTPTVVVTTSVWADVVANVACDGPVRIETVIPIGADAHAFEPSLADRARMEGADLIVANGLRLELGLADLIDAAEASGTPVFRAGEQVDTIAYGGHHDHGDDADLDHDHGDEADPDPGANGGTEGDDPHVWFDPLRVADVVPVLADRLVDDVGLDPAAVEACAAQYRAELERLDASIARRVALLPTERRLLVTVHDTLGYFADRYGFELVGTVSPSSTGLAETNPAYLEALAQEMERTGSRAVFVEASAATDDAEALARRVDGAEVVTLFSESLSQPGGGAETYLDFMALNTERIVETLG